MKSDKGSIKVNGNQAYEIQESLDKIALIKESGFGQSDIKIKDLIKYATSIYPRWDNNYKNYLINLFNINEKKNYSNLSRGSRTIVSLIIGMASRSEYTLFDEPSAGLDASNRYIFYKELLKDFEENPRTIIISTHLIDEVSKIFERIVIIDNKNIILEDELEKIMSMSYSIEGESNSINKIIDKSLVINEEFIGGKTIYYIFGEIDKSIKEALKESNAKISKLNLQELFVYLTTGGNNDSAK